MSEPVYPVGSRSAALVTSFFSLCLVTIAAADPTHRKPLLQQCHQGLGGLRLSFGRNLLKNGLDRTLDQRAQDCLRVQANRTSHGDRPGQDADRIGPAGSRTLGTSREVIDGGEMTVWHGTSMTGSGPSTQPLPSKGTCGSKQLCCTANPR
jgi:hypothetical protein